MQGCCNTLCNTNTNTSHFLFKRGVTVLQPGAHLTVCQSLHLPVLAAACEHHHDTFPVGAGHLWDVTVDELMVLIYHKVFEVPRCQDPALATGCIVDSTRIPDLVPPGLVEDGGSGQLRLVREKAERQTVK